jgi:Ca2+-binding RTX toxin-like protein
MTGATSKTYVVRSGDDLRRLDVVVTATNSGGSGVHASRTSALVGRLFRGTVSADFLRGTTGSDWMALRGGADVAYGGPGNDLIAGGGGRDHVYAGRGRDLIRLADGLPDWVSCGRGVDRVRADRFDRVTSTCEHVSRT